MKLAKKTLSVALAAVMAASSLAGTVSAFAAGPTFLPKSDPVYKAISVGTTTVTPDVKIDTKYASTKADIEAGKVTAEQNKNSQIDETTLSNYFSFTPAKTGVYSISVKSAPVYEGYSYSTYKQYLDKGYKEADAKAASKTYSDSYKNLFEDSDFTTPLTEKKNTDSVTIDNVTGKDEFLSSPATTKAGSYEGKTVLSWKYDEKSGKVVADKEDKYAGAKSASASIKGDYLVAKRTYYFKVTVNSFLGTEEVTNDKKETYVNVVKTAAKPSAQITIGMESNDVTYSKGYYTSDSSKSNYSADVKKQKVTVPPTYIGKDYTGEEVTFNGERAIVTKENNYVPYVERDINVAYFSAYYNGTNASATVKDTVDGNKVTAFANSSKALQTLTLGKNVATVSGCDEDDAPNLKKVVITNPDYVVDTTTFSVKDVTITAPSNSIAYLTAVRAGFKVNVTCAHKWVVTKAATIFATGVKKCSECDATATVAKVRFAPTAKASKKKIVVKGNAGKVAKLAVWVYNSNGKLVKKQVKKNVTKNTVKVAKAGKYTVKVKAYGTKGAKTASVKKTVKVK